MIGHQTFTKLNKSNSFSKLAGSRQIGLFHLSRCNWTSLRFFLSARLARCIHTLPPPPPPLPLLASSLTNVKHSRSMCRSHRKILKLGTPKINSKEQNLQFFELFKAWKAQTADGGYFVVFEMSAADKRIVSFGFKARGWCQPPWLGFCWNWQAISQKSTWLNRRQYS